MPPSTLRVERHFHVLVVSAAGFRLLCPGPTDACRAYVDCLEGCCTVAREYNFTADGALGHGVHHRYDGGTWLAATDDCVFVVAGVADLAAEILVNGVGLPTGRYLVRPTHDPDGDRFELGWVGAGRVQVQGDYFHGRLPLPGVVYAGRRAPRFPESKWSNPFVPGKTAGQIIPAGYSGIHVRDAAHAVDLYGQLMAALPSWQREARDELAGRILGCWCSPDVPCHCDHLLQVANTEAVTACSGQP